MPKILITGNGFDLSIGLPTTYSDFMRILRYSEISENSDFDSIYSQCSNYSQIKSTFKKCLIDKSNLMKLRELMSTNIWYQFFKNEFEIESWIDFENKIEYVLKILFTSVENFRTKIFSKGSMQENTNIYSISLFDGNIEVFEVLKIFNVIKAPKGVFNIRLNDDYLLQKYNHYIDINVDEITKMLIRELMCFKMIFNLYFETFIFPLYKGMSLNVRKNLFNTIQRHYTFNYTPTFEKVFTTSCTTSFLHGKIDSQNNKIVLGINEIPSNENIDKRYFLPFTKYFQKFNNNTDYTFLEEFIKKNKLNYQFFFWGHSLDKSDEDYINEVFDFVGDLVSRVKKIIVIYHNEESKESLLLNLLNIRGKKNIQDLMRGKILEFYTIDDSKLLFELSREISIPSTIP